MDISNGSINAQYYKTRITGYHETDIEHPSFSIPTISQVRVHTFRYMLFLISYYYIIAIAFFIICWIHLFAYNKFKFWNTFFINDIFIFCAKMSYEYDVLKI